MIQAAFPEKRFNYEIKLFFINICMLFLFFFIYFSFRARKNISDLSISMNSAIKWLYCRHTNLPKQVLHIEMKLQIIIKKSLRRAKKVLRDYSAGVRCKDICFRHFQRTQSMRRELQSTVMIDLGMNES